MSGRGSQFVKGDTNSDSSSLNGDDSNNAGVSDESKHVTTRVEANNSHGDGDAYVAVNRETAVSDESSA